MGIVLAVILFIIVILIIYEGVKNLDGRSWGGWL